MSGYQRLTSLLLTLLMAIGIALPPNLVAQTTPTTGDPAPTGKTMDDYVRERGFYEPTGAYIADKISNNRTNFDMVRDYAVKFADKAGADPVLVVWWAFIETGAPVSPYTWNNCVNVTTYAPDYVCGSDNWQIAYGQQYNVAYNRLVDAFEAVYGNPNDRQKVQQVIQAVLDKSEVGGTAPSTYTVSDLQAGARSGDARKWTLMLSRDPGISVYLLSTALVTFNRDEAFGWGSFYQEQWQNYSNALNDVLEAWGTAGSPGTTGSGSGFGPTEPPIKLEVPDCPGVIRDINAYNIPPSIYPKPNCGGGTPGSGAVNGPTGVCTTDPNVQAYGTGEKAPPDGSIFWTIINATTGTISQGFGPTSFSGASYDNYDYTLNVQGHPGVDISSTSGTKLYTPVEGKVITAGGTQYFLHNATVADHTGELKIELSNGDQMVFGHMERIEVNVGDQLKAGDYLGLAGIGALPDRPGTGGPHLHLEYRKKLAHANGEYTALDPRDVFGCASPGTTPPADDTGPQVQGISTEGGQVLQATTVAPNFGTFQQKYGFPAPTGPSEIDFEQHANDIAVLRDLAVKYAPTHGIEPEMVVWWTLVETLPPYNSVSYSNCSDDTYEVDINCYEPSSGGWQIGYGQQFAVLDSLPEAYFDVYGADTSAAKVKQIGQSVLDKAGINKTFPNYSLDQIMAGSSTSSQVDMNYWAYTIMRDPGISAWLLALEFSWDIGAAKDNGLTYRDHTCTWGPYYCNPDLWQRFANTLNDVLLNWGIPGSAVTGQVCQIGVPSSTSSCSTIPDSLNGLTTEEFVQKINQNMSAYKEISTCANVPWEMMAAIHLRETGLNPDYRGNNGGSWQLDPPPAGVDQFNFVEAGCVAGKMLADKIEQQFGGDGLKALSSTMDPTKLDDEYAIKAAFFGYNGTGGWQGNVEKGCTQAIDGNEDWNWDCSAYVMNNMDANHTDMCIVGSIDGGSTNTYCDGNDGAWKIYYKLFFSTYDASGQLLVYGGRCSVGNEVINGMSAPTVAGKSINSQFWAGGHIGIDIGNEAGDPIFAIADGEIISSGWSDAGGYYLILHLEAQGSRPEMWVYYGHLDGDELPDLHGNSMSVLAGQKIGITGALTVTRPDGGQGPNGNTLGPHLHFDLRLTPNESQNIEDHVNPCDLDIMKNSYPELDCSAP